MADRIERYLGRLESELEGRVSGDRLEGILVEVEGHLRESEEAYRELGEPDELANRFAVEGFGGIAEFNSIGNAGELGHRKTQFWRGTAMIFGVLASIGTVLSTTIFTNMPQLIAHSLLPLGVIGVAAIFLHGSVWKKVGLGWIVGVTLVSALFSSSGRVAILDGTPILGMEFGDKVIISGGELFSVAERERDFQKANQFLEVAERCQGAAREGVTNLMGFIRIDPDQKVLMISKSNDGLAWIWTTDFDGARQSWLRHGDEFIPWARSRAVVAENRYEAALQFKEGALPKSALQMIMLLGQPIGNSALALFLVTGLGVCVRRGVDKFLGWTRRARFAKGGN